MNNQFVAFCRGWLYKSTCFYISFRWSTFVPHHKGLYTSAQGAPSETRCLHSTFTEKFRWARSRSWVRHGRRGIHSSFPESVYRTLLVNGHNTFNMRLQHKNSIFTYGYYRSETRFFLKNWAGLACFRMTYGQPTSGCFCNHPTTTTSTNNKTLSISPSPSSLLVVIGCDVLRSNLLWFLMTRTSQFYVWRWLYI